MKKKEKSRFKIGIIIAIVILTLMANSYTEKQSSQVKKITKKYNNTKAELNTSKKELSSCKKELREVSVDAAKAEKEQIEKDIESLKSEKENLNQEIIKIKGEPRTYPAGYLKAGSDFEVGRYKIYNGSSNFVVHDSLGSLKVNIILGNGDYEVSEYIYQFKSGDEIKANSSFTMISIN